MAKSAEERSAAASRALPARSRSGGRFIYEPVNPDAESRQRQGRRHRGGRSGAREEMGVSREVLSSHYLLQIALLDSSCHAELERKFILPHFDIALSLRVPHAKDHRDVPAWSCGRRMSIAISFE